MFHLVSYFLFIGGSSTQVTQNPLGLTFDAFFTTLIFIVVSVESRSAGRGMRQRIEGRIEASLVTRRHIHVAKLRIRVRDAAARAYGDVRAVAALFPGREPEEPLARRFARRVAPAVDVAGRGRELTCEARARIQGAVGPDRVRVLHVHMAGAVVHAVVRPEAMPLGLFAQERHLVVEQVAALA